MPIGQNSIKRVENGGYTKIESTAPDMENSTLEAKKPATVQVEKKPSGSKKAKDTAKKASNDAPAVKKPEEKKKSTKTAPASKKSATPSKKSESTAKKESAAKKVSPAPAPAKAEEKKPDGFERYSFGDELPTHLL